MDIEQSADACGGLAWISQRLFEVEGRLATDLDDGKPLDDRARLLLARSSRRHGQHAQWWRAALPDSPALAGAERVRPPTDAWVRLLAHLEGAAPTEALAAIYEVALPQLAFVIEHLGQELLPVSDGAVIRIARMVAADLAEEQYDSREVWNTPSVPSDDGLEELASGFADDYREKRWPPLVTLPR
ncbi:hypothetical protein [Candidatus Poriferisocius sp.]|uniref:hypothetical protein n=1 Tax=Candidatus Poriferisocius sp. TaxID=3101276 RepID=UPI003B01D995